MTKMLLTAALSLGTLAAAPATAAPVETLTHAGVTYEYAVTQKGSTRVITGMDKTNRRTFVLRVRGGRVEGTMDGNPVSFPLRDVKPIVRGTVTEVAAR